jgi:hypothetical protein
MVKRSSQLTCTAALSPQVARGYTVFFSSPSRDIDGDTMGFLDPFFIRMTPYYFYRTGTLNLFRSSLESKYYVKYFEHGIKHPDISEEPGLLLVSRSPETIVI